MSARVPVAFRSLALVIVGLTGIAGAAIGATAAAKPSLEYVGGMLLIRPPGLSAAAGAERARAVMEAARSPQVIGPLAAGGVGPDVATRTSGSFDRVTGIGLIQVRASSSTTAAGDVSELAAGAIDLNMLRPAMTRGSLVVGSFGTGLDLWNTFPTAFGRAPQRVKRVEVSPGTRVLGAACRAETRCALWLRLLYPFRRGVEYRITARARGIGSTVPLTALLGSTSGDSAAVEHPVDDRWRQYTVAWTPARDTASAEAVFMVRPLSSAGFQIGDVVFTDSSAAAPVAPAAIADSGFVTLYPAETMLVRDRRGTVAVSAVAGAVVGLAVGLVALLFFGMASRRKQQHRQHHPHE